LVSDSRNTVHSNYFIAQTPILARVVEDHRAIICHRRTPDDPLGIELRTPTQYRGSRNVQMKYF